METTKHAVNTTSIATFSPSNIIYIVGGSASRLFPDELEDLLEVSRQQTVSDFPLRRCSYGPDDHKRVSKERKTTINKRRGRIQAIWTGQSPLHRVFEMTPQRGLRQLGSSRTSGISDGSIFYQCVLAFENPLVARVWVYRTLPEVARRVQYLRIGLLDGKNGGAIRDKNFITLLSELTTRCPNLKHTAFYWFRLRTDRKVRENTDPSPETWKLASNLAQLPGLKELRLKRERALDWKEVTGQPSPNGCIQDKSRHLSLCYAHGPKIEEACKAMERIRWPETRVVWHDWIACLINLLS